jgi:predicted Zn-dependent protease with MMP-like domain
MVDIEREAFEELVRRAVEALPAEFRDRLDVDIVVEDAAHSEDYARTRVAPGSTLLGVYRGVPLTRRGAFYNMAVPDRIAIFQRPIQRLARDTDDLEARVRRVVLHEVAHYFGISDERLHEIDAY